MFCLDTGTFEQKEKLLEAVLEQWGPRQGSGYHVATSQRRDVSTSRRPHVATSQRHDVESTLQKSTSGIVVTSQSRDVATSRCQLEICSSSFKVRMGQKLGYREAYERRHGIPEQGDTDFEEVPGICTVFHCWIFLDIRMMFLILNIFFFSFIMF